ncbi:MAG: NUDIX domain-containing protein [Saccharospirillaceae bacterium]|nr:NUDIX domain-containing protein [Pseudomonadales bacterium]NRB78271.1 NUDIX domain-containing protein [Saccharospirillaceae bacterium]
MKFNVTKRNTLYEGFYRLDKLTIEHDRYDGQSQFIERELLVRHDAVCVLLFDPLKDKIVLIEQFRVGAIEHGNAWLLEIVAGLIDKDEQPEEVAHREAFEEAGVEISQLTPITQYQSSPGGTNEKIHLFIANVDSSKAFGTHGVEEESEDIKVVVISKNEAFELVNQGKINNASALISLQWLIINESKLRDLWQI